MNVLAATWGHDTRKKQRCLPHVWLGELNRCMGRISTGLSAALICWAGGIAAAHAAPSLSAERINGTYEYNQGRNNFSTVTIELLPNGRLDVSFQLQFQLPGAISPNLGETAGQASLRGNVATYKGANQPACTISIEFRPGNMLEVAQQGDSFECGFGHHVMADGSYAKTSGRKPSSERLSTDPTDRTKLGQAALENEQQASGALQVIAARKARIEELTAQRKAALKDLTSQKAELDKRTRAGAALEKKGNRAGAAAEYRVAVDLGSKLLTSLSALRALEDELAQLVSEVAQALADAKVSAKAVRTDLTKLSGLANASAADAKKSAAAAATAFSKPNAALGVTPAAPFSAQREKARKDDEQLAVEVAQNRASLAEVNAAAKAKP